MNRKGPKSYEDFKDNPSFLREYIKLIQEEHAAEINYLRSGFHTCHSECPRDICVKFRAKDAEIEELKSKLSASEWVRKDNALRTYDGLTEKLQSSREIISTLEEALSKIQKVYSDPAFKHTPLVFHALAQVSLTALKEWKEKQK